MLARMPVCRLLHPFSFDKNDNTEQTGRLKEHKSPCLLLALFDFFHSLRNIIFSAVAFILDLCFALTPRKWFQFLRTVAPTFWVLKQIGPFPKVLTGKQLTFLPY